MKYNKKDIEQTLAKLNADTEYFFSILDSIAEKRIQEKKEKEEVRASQIYIDNNNIYDLPQYDMTMKDFFDHIAEEYQENDVYGDYDLNEPDVIEYFKVGEQFYKVEFHIETYWISDPSVRKWAVGDITVKSFNQISNYEIVEDKKKYIVIKLK